MTPPYVVDLHAHFPMHVDPMQTFRRSLRHQARHHEKLIDRLKFLVLELADRFWNRASPLDGHAVTIDTLARGNVGVALSVAYCPFLELESLHGAPPEDHYFREVKRLLENVEAVIASDDRATIVRDFAELTAARSAGKVALVHAIEGGLHLGSHPDAIERHVAALAAMGLGYVTVAHLFFRDVATNVPALPFLSDGVYRHLFPQDPAIGLTARGKAMVRSMLRHGVLVDLTHMSERGMEETFELFDAVDPEKKVPLLASHVACAHPGGFAYNLGERWVKKIAERGGVCGIIYCDHYVRDGDGAQTKTFAESMARIKDQVDRLRTWGGDDVLAIGSDLDGFIKPSLAGLESARDHERLAQALVDTYGSALAEKICHKNPLRVLETGWRRGV